ncbi:hypothetical protein NL676_034676 [Syzygium grande]|nr:hypothetical protein NL676_034676 [Syzygium grande]
MASPGEKGSLDPYQEYLHRKNSRENLDRFIPNCSAMDFDYARSLFTLGKKWKEKSAVMSTSSEAYQKFLAEALDMNRSRILAFKNKLPTPVELIPQSWLSPATSQSKSTKPCRSIPKACQRTLDAPDILDDYYLNLLDWGANNMVAIALSRSVYLWNASNGSATELVTFNDEEGPVTSVSWAPDGQNIAIGLQNSHVQLWDFSAQRQLRTFRGGHRLRVCSLAWNNHILTTGGQFTCLRRERPEHKILEHMHGRMSEFSGHGSQVCALLWSMRERELLSSHGLTENQLILWKYPSMGTMAELTGHASRVLFLAQSPDGCTVASAAADEKLMFWHVFGIPELAKQEPKTSSKPFAHWHITLSKKELDTSAVVEFMVPAPLPVEMVKASSELYSEGSRSPSGRGRGRGSRGRPRARGNGFVNSEYNDGGWGRNQGYARGRVKEEDMVFVAAEGEDIMDLMLIHSKTEDTIKNHLLRRGGFNWPMPAETNR